VSKGWRDASVSPTGNVHLNILAQAGAETALGALLYPFIYEWTRIPSTACVVVQRLVALCPCMVGQRRVALFPWFGTGFLCVKWRCLNADTKYHVSSIQEQGAGPGSPPCPFCNIRMT
jgi:hypothetical protein